MERYDGVEITGPFERVQSIFVDGRKHLPVKLIRHRQGHQRQASA